MSSFTNLKLKCKYLKKCIKNINRQKFVNEIVNYDESSYMIKFENFGEKNPDKILYLFTTFDDNSGFFAVIRSLLNAIYFADTLNFDIVVDFSKNFIYYDEDMSKEYSNPFDYYFKPLSVINLNEVYKSQNVVKFSRKHNQLAEINYKNKDGYNVSDQYIDKMAMLYAKYIHLKPEIESKIISEMNSLFSGKRTLGIHFRGTDFTKGWKKHPKGLQYSDYLEFIEQALTNGNYEKIFLATDDINAIEYFKNIFGNMICYYSEVFRSENNIGTHFSTSERKYHKYLLGYEVLRDMLTLVECDGLIAGLSQVSTCAQIAKKAQKKTYKYLHIINKGMHT